MRHRGLGDGEQAKRIETEPTPSQIEWIKYSRSNFSGTSRRNGLGRDILSVCYRTQHDDERTEARGNEFLC